MRFNFINLGSALCALVWAGCSIAKVDIVPYDDIPVSIAIPVDVETILRMPEAVEVGLPAAFSGVVKVEITNKVVLITANKAIEGRIALRGVSSSNTIYLIDVTASASAPKNSFQVINATGVAAASDQGGLEGDAGTDDVRMALTRFAAKEFYAPDRLRGGLKASRVALPIEITELYRGGAVIAQPRASWRYRNLYVTAVEMKNNTPDGRELDPRLLRGRWLTATFQHGFLSASGSLNSSTMLYLVSAQSYGDSL